MRASVLLSIRKEYWTVVLILLSISQNDHRSEISTVFWRTERLLSSTNVCQPLAKHLIDASCCVGHSCLWQKWTVTLLLVSQARVRNAMQYVGPAFA